MKKSINLIIVLAILVTIIFLVSCSSNKPEKDLRYARRYFWVEYLTVKGNDKSLSSVSLYSEGMFSWGSLLRQLSKGDSTVSKSMALINFIEFKDEQDWNNFNK